MSARHFPTDPEIDQWISSHFLNQPKAVANGSAAWAYLDCPDQDHTKIRGAVRQIMAAESVSLLPLCSHVGQIRPQVLICDPPVVVCASCLPSRMAIIETLGHRWKFQCDRCGVRTQMLTPCALAGLGFLTVSGHLCNGCAAEDQRRAAEHIDQVVMVGNRRARRRGGAR